MAASEYYTIFMFYVLNITLFFMKYEELIIDFLSVCMILSGVFFFFVLLFISAPYGRYSSQKWGWTFAVRYSWIVQECPAFFIPMGLLIYRYYYIPEPVNIASVVGIFAFAGHYFQRSLIYPLLIRGGKPTPCVPFFLAFIFCILNGYMQGRSLTTYQPLPDGHLSTIRAICGLSVFFAGMIINIHSDHVLRNLRKPGESGYKIPRGGAFEYVSGANFLGEMIEWTGFAIYCWNLASFAFAFFTFANLVPRAIAHHRFYLSKFEDYPKQRRAIFPFIL